MRFELSINCDNADFQPSPVLQVARLLRTVANYLERRGDDIGVITDPNGNTVGTFTLIKE